MHDLTAFRLRVQAGDGTLRDVALASQHAAEAVRRAAQLGLVVLAVESTAAAMPRSESVRVRFSLLLFSQELVALTDAGLNLNEALATLLAKERQPACASLLQSLLSELSKGRNFSDVLADHPQQFPVVYVATVRAAERTGDLSRALVRFIAYQLQFDAIRKKLVAACIYPSMLLLVGSAVTLFLVGYVVPRFSQVYASAGREVPAMSAALLRLGALVDRHGLLLLAAVVAGAALIAVWLIRRGGWQALLEGVLMLPGVAARAAQFRLARFYRAMGLLLAAGIALPRALGMVEGLLAPRERERLARVRSLVEEGRPLSYALVEQELASPVARSLLTVGERTGQLADMLERSARFHDDDLERWIDWSSRLLEPVLMALIGLVIGAVVLLMYLPIFELAGSLQ